MHVYKVQLKMARSVLPYPFYVEESGNVRRQDFWKGHPLRVIGFQRSLKNNRVDLLWHEALSAPGKATGMYLVTSDADGDFSTHRSAVASMVPYGEAKA